jgi:hypothetical protein
VAYTTNDKGGGMDFTQPGWWAVAIAALGGFFGWRIATAKDAVRIEALKASVEKLEAKVSGVETGRAQDRVALATMAANIESIGRTLARLENKLDGKADKP